jgi:hypothetical protein
VKPPRRRSFNGTGLLLHALHRKAVVAFVAAASTSKNSLPCVWRSRPPRSIDGTLPFFILRTAVHLKPAPKRTRVSSTAWPHSIAVP